MCIVYKATNLVSNEIYIGCTSLSLEQRIKSHKDRAFSEKSRFQKDLHDLGIDNFKFEILEECDISLMYEREIFYIESFNTFLGFGYNETSGGMGISGMSQLIKNKISDTKSGVPNLKKRGTSLPKEDKIKISRTLGGNIVKLTHRYTGEVIYLDYVTQGKKIGLNPSLICAVIKGKRKHHKNYYCEYVKQANTEVTEETKKSSTP